MWNSYRKAVMAKLFQATGAGSLWLPCSQQEVAMAIQVVAQSSSWRRGSGRVGLA
jgi:hypothetical protein